MMIRRAYAILISSVCSHDLIEIESGSALPYVRAAGIGIMYPVPAYAGISLSPMEASRGRVSVNGQDRQPAEIAHRVNANGHRVAVLFF